MYSQKLRPYRSRQLDACQGHARDLASPLTETLKRHTDALLKSLSENELLKEVNEELKKQVNEVQDRQQQMESKHKEELRRNEKIIRHLQQSQAHSDSYVADLEVQWNERFEKLEVRLQEVLAEKEVLRRRMKLAETVHMMQTVQTTMTATNTYELQQERRKEENQTQKKLTLLTNRHQSSVTKASCIVNKRKVDEQAAHKPQCRDAAKRKRVMNTNGHKYIHLKEERRCSVSKREWMYERKTMNVV